MRAGDDVGGFDCRDTRPAVDEEYWPSLSEEKRIAAGRAALRDDDAITRGLRVKLGGDGERTADDGWGLRPREMITGFQNKLTLGTEIGVAILGAPGSKRQHISARGVGIPLRGEFFQLDWLRARQIVQLRAVPLHIVKFPRLVLLTN